MFLMETIHLPKHLSETLNFINLVLFEDKKEFRGKEVLFTLIQVQVINLLSFCFLF